MQCATFLTDNAILESVVASQDLLRALGQWTIRPYFSNIAAISRRALGQTLLRKKKGSYKIASNGKRRLRRPQNRKTKTQPAVTPDSYNVLDNTLSARNLEGDDTTSSLP
jgi:hypothetical protein